MISVKVSRRRGRELTGPVFSRILIVGDNATTRYQLGEVRHSIEQGVNHEASNQPISGTVAERNEHQGHKSGDGISNVSPVDACNLPHHQASNLGGISGLHFSSVKGSLTMTRVLPVAQGGIDAKIGAKNIETMKQRPVVIAVSPVLPPSAIPAPDSM